MKRRIIEALIPVTMWLLENWSRRQRPTVMVLPKPTRFERVRCFLRKTHLDFTARIEIRTDGLRKYWTALEDGLT